ncbi:ferrochelatase [Silvanigrella aquatica]|uniref:Ferrochelatase n=1 Tax=Silvanigrella aquatica TaxID=1915309 RepID=A0A1L4D055_9BACT|nr:ferrochelatase [Silvanigrella aquatica]APJ03585.1 ferrochelatase [Silvanigrella aquatica]
MDLNQKIGVLLVNVGTPDAPETSAVRRYLKEFLSDPRVIDIPAFARFLLLRLIILPFRSSKSAHAYKTVWLPEGSPLMIHSQSLGKNVSEILGDHYFIEVCMRYQNPSLETAIKNLIAKGVNKIVVFPLFPQYSSAATGTVFEKVGEIANKMWNVPPLVYVPSFYNHPGFIESFSQVATPLLNEFQPDFVLFSYHGLPERHVKKSDQSHGKYCLADIKCCDKIVHANSYCYRAQCYATTKAIVKSLGLSKEGYTTSFQSRLGKSPWIKPYTDLVLPELAQKGVKRIAVMCPAFVADCLETLEEIKIRAKEQWLSLGGEDLTLVPSLNSHPYWSDVVAKMIQSAAR